MVKPASPHKRLKLYTEQPPQEVRPQIESVACLPELFRAFQSATGWTLDYLSGPETCVPADVAWSAPLGGGPAFAPGFLALEAPQEEPQRNERTSQEERERHTSKTERRRTNRQAAPSSALRPATPASALPPRPIDLGHAGRLAGAVAAMLGELLDTRRHLWQREAELAAGVPLVPHREEQKHLAARLEAVLQSAAEAVGGDAVALYLLDEATTELKLRCCWGLPFDRFTAPARPLQGALADLEALLGHAVVLDDERTLRMWGVPEDFPTAVCVPVSTPTTLLGTMWLFCGKRRNFNDRDTNILEIIAGRVASDLERAMLLHEGTEAAQLKKQLAAAERLQQSELPTLAPLLDGWELAGGTSQAGGVGGAFHDWFCLPQGLLAVTVGKAVEQGVPGSLTANALKAAARAHARYHRQAERILQQVNLTLWTGSAGDQHASLFCGLIETATGRVCCAAGGSLSVLRLHDDGWESLGQTSPLLGQSPETDFEQFGYELQPGETLVAFTHSPCDASESNRRVQNEAKMAEALADKLDLTAEELLAAARRVLESQAAGPNRQDFSLLVVKRTTA